MLEYLHRLLLAQRHEQDRAFIDALFIHGRLPNV
jgi:hypothetical protein